MPFFTWNTNVLPPTSPKLFVLKRETRNYYPDIVEYRNNFNLGKVVFDLLGVSEGIYYFYYLCMALQSEANSDTDMGVNPIWSIPIPHQIGQFQLYQFQFHFFIDSFY